jgi:mRNA interferase MazF
VVSPDPQGRDVIVAFISSVVLPPVPSTNTDFILPMDHPDFPKTGLKKTSVFKMNKLLVLERSRILSCLGHISQEIQKELDLCLKRALRLS